MVGLIGTGLFPSAAGLGAPIYIYTQLGFGMMGLSILIQTNNALRARTAFERVGLGRVMSATASVGMLVGNALNGNWYSEAQHTLFAKGNLDVARKLFMRGDEKDKVSYRTMGHRAMDVLKNMLGFKPTAAPASVPVPVSSSIDLSVEESNPGQKAVENTPRVVPGVVNAQRPDVLEFLFPGGYYAYNTVIPFLRAEVLFTF